MADRPTIILVVVEHACGDCLSRLGHPVAETPHLDNLSLEGTV